MECFGCLDADLRRINALCAVLSIRSQRIIDAVLMANTVLYKTLFLH